MSVRIIFESVTDGWAYYPLIKYLAFFEFNNSFNPFIEDLKIVLIPFSGIFIHSIFLKIFGYSTFIIIEFFAICSVSVVIFLFLFIDIFKIDLTSLLEERAREFYWEGWRRNDQIRFGTFLDSFQEKPVSTETYLLFPIPPSALSTNPNLIQNPGY